MENSRYEIVGPFCVKLSNFSGD